MFKQQNKLQNLNMDLRSFGNCLHFYITINHYNLLLKTSFATIIGSAQPTSPNGANIEDDVATALDILSKGQLNQVKNVSQTIKLHRQIHCDLFDYNGYST